MEPVTCKCGKEVHPERVELLGTDVCIDCANKGVGQTRVKGVMIFDHKTAPTINIIHSDEAFNYVKEASKRVGQKSVIQMQLMRPPPCKHNLKPSHS